MQFLIIFIICLLLLAILAFAFGVNIKKLKEMTNVENLDVIAKKYPDNIEICKEYLKKLNNNSVRTKYV